MSAGVLAGPRPPSTVRSAVAWWTIAVGAGALETIGTVAVQAADGAADSALAVGVGVRVAVYTIVLLVVAALWRGNRWARVGLAVGLGGLGLLSLVADPVGWLASGNSVWDGLRAADVQLALLIAVRSVHVAAVLAACVLMFRPASNRYFSRH